MKIFPSIISADLLDLRGVLGILDTEADGYHLDVMDGHFVHNITWGPAFVNAIKHATAKPLQVHMMVSDPGFWLERFELGAGDSIIFHIEAAHELGVAEKIVKRIKNMSMRVGIALNPDTPVAAVVPFLPQLDELLVMSVKPGFSGQSFIDITPKLAELQAIFATMLVRPSLCVDGGVNADNIRLLASHGVDCVGAAGALFASGDPCNNVRILRRAAL